MFTVYFAFNRHRWRFHYTFGSYTWVVSFGGVQIGIIKYDLEHYLQNCYDQMDRLTENLNALKQKVEGYLKEKDDVEQHDP